MKKWAKKRKREMELADYKELARLFELVTKICELEEELERSRHFVVGPN